MTADREDAFEDFDFCEDDAPLIESRFVTKFKKNSKAGLTKVPRPKFEKELPKSGTKSFKSKLNKPIRLPKSHDQDNI